MSTFNRIKVILICSAVMLMAACNHDVDEFKFKANVVAAGWCSASQPYYILDIISPDSLGEPLTSNGVTYRNAVRAYKASRLLYSGDTIYGVGYFTKSYSALNCNTVPDYTLPELILLSVDEEAF